MYRLIFLFLILIILLLHIRLSTNVPQCGKSSNLNISVRILGGDVVNPPHSQPWVVRLGRCCECTGTLISNRHVLTAAHCELFVNPQVATLGDHDARKIEIGEIEIKIKSVTKHPLYWLEGDTAAYDFAIWTLDEPVTFSNTIQPICLPNTLNEDYLGYQVMNSGWGMSVWNENSSYPGYDRNNQVLRTVNLTVLPISECKNAKWLSDRLDKITTPGRTINETFMICGGLYQNEVQGKWIGPNKGDSGGK